jgi:hypothetical protein
LQICEDGIDSFQGSEQVFRGTTGDEELVAVYVFDEKVRVGNVVPEIGNVVKCCAGGSFCGEAAIFVDHYSTEPVFLKPELIVRNLPLKVGFRTIFV